jgi:hypothetical protein
VIGAKSGDREDWNDCKSFLHFGSPFAEPPEPRQCGGQKEMCAWKTWSHVRFQNVSE